MLLPSPDRRAWWILPLAAGLCLGGAHLHPAVSLAAWPGFALFACVLATAPSWWSRLLSSVLVSWFSLFVAQIWLSLCIANYMGPVIHQDQAPIWMSTLVWGLATSIETTHRALPILLGALIFRRWPVRLWLPPAFLAGEALGGSYGFMMGDLLHSQWNNPAVLRSLALVGLPMTALLACYASAALGESMAKGSRRHGVLLAMPVMAWFSLLPPIPAADEALAGVAAVHMAEINRRPSPAEVPPDVDLLVWPEASMRGQHPMAEGAQTHPARLADLAGWAGPRHVVNVVASIGDHTLNAIGVTDRSGAVLRIRGKQALTPWGERAWGGIDPLKSPLIPGKAPPILEMSGRKLVATLCYEVYAGDLFREGAAQGGDLIVNIANDRAYGPSTLGIRQAIGVLALRAAETHLPAVRASLWGSAAIISSTGAVLATSAPGTTGVLRSDEKPGRSTGPAIQACLEDRASP